MSAGSAGPQPEGVGAPDFGAVVADATASAAFARSDAACDVDAHAEALAASKRATISRALRFMRIPRPDFGVRRKSEPVRRSRGEQGREAGLGWHGVRSSLQTRAETLRPR